MKPEIDYSLYLVTDRELMSTKTLEEAVEQAIIGGATVIQLREKSCSSLDFYNTALSMRAITDKYKTPLIINDRVDIALAVHADGVHIGQSDIPSKIIRRIIGDDMLLGVSASTLEEAITAKMDGADYIGVGAMYATGTKTNARITTKGELLKIRAAVDIPIVVIGGINMATLKDFFETEIDGIAVVSAIISQKDIMRASMELKKCFNKKIKVLID